MENYTHFAIYKPTNKIVNGWDYNGYDNNELKIYKKDYFINDLLDMGMDPKDITILTKKGCSQKGINPLDNNNWQNYPFNNKLTLNETELKDLISEITLNVLKEFIGPENGYADYKYNDMNYQNVYEEAEYFLAKNGEKIHSVKELIKMLGYRFESFNESDAEIVYDACEQAFTEYYENI